MVSGSIFGAIGSQKVAKMRLKSDSKNTSKKGGRQDVRLIPGWSEPGPRRGVKGGGKPPPWGSVNR